MKPSNIDPLVAAIALACLATAGMFSCSSAKADETDKTVVGLHLASIHVPSYSYQNNANPGVYVRHESGVTAGAYFNTLRRTSVYLGYTTPELAYLSLTVGAITGYQKKATSVTQESCPAPAGYVCTQDVTHYEGSSKGAVTLMLAPSLRLPTVMTLTPRLSVIPRFGAGSSTVLHLSIERKFL